MRELRNETLASENIKKQLPAISQNGLLNKVPAKRKVLIENAAEKDLKEINRILGSSMSPTSASDDMKM